MPPGPSLDRTAQTKNPASKKGFYASAIHLLKLKHIANFLERGRQIGIPITHPFEIRKILQTLRKEDSLPDGAGLARITRKTNQVAARTVLLQTLKKGGGTIRGTIIHKYQRHFRRILQEAVYIEP